MFFYLSKILWFFLDPGNAFLFALLVGLILTATRWRGFGKLLVTLSLAFAVLVTFVPIGKYMVRSLEQRFPMPEPMPDKIDGIVVLGGVIDPVLSSHLERPVINGAVERITRSAALARAYPSARLIYSGGSGSLVDQQLREADYVASLYQELGVTEPQLTLERDARNTWENASKVFEIAKPQPGENWLLVTSAFHMPRAVGVFRRFGWETIPYPVDYSSSAEVPIRSPMSFSAGLSGFSGGLHEWIGLTAYWLTGKTGAAFPKPRTMEQP
jgi:uncharacterized SAM-binding protein YcdF (DUF218 family)